MNEARIHGKYARYDAIVGCIEGYEGARIGIPHFPDEDFEIDDAEDEFAEEIIEQKFGFKPEMM